MISRLVVVALLSSACSCADDRDAGPASSVSARLPGGDTTNTLMLGSNAYIRPAANITEDHEGLFYSGNSLFNRPWVEAPSSVQSRDGLGPLFNARSCSACHLKDGRGKPPESPEEAPLGYLLRLSIQGPDGPLPHPTYGNQLQPFSVGDVRPEATPVVTYTDLSGAYADGTEYTLLEPFIELQTPAYGPIDGLMISARVAPAVIGMGLLEAIPEDRLEEIADPDDLDGDGISGKVQRLSHGAAAGRFGWKAEEPTVAAQVAGALHGDMGLTSPDRSEPNCTSEQMECLNAVSGGSPEVEAAPFERMVLYTSLLAVPVRRNWDNKKVIRGEELFHQAGCASCHVPSHRTGDHALTEVSNQVIWPYTDLLLHDMGDGLADQRPIGTANGRDWRTPPLWGIGLLQAVNKHERLLHDGRARGVAEAVLWHGGEAKSSRDAFIEMSKTDRDDLVSFVRSL
ncbi:MAG: di-heme oxidoredictase family protein [Myxococcota bacterium]|nr:di-heme oxidoredictase family protein [Myxococcota bacterium]